MKDKVVLVTGGTGGIGQETARGLAAQGATVVITGRNRERGEAVARTLRDSTGNPEVSYLQVDLSSREEIERFASEFQQRYDRLDVLVNNAGGIFWERQTNPEGLELTFALNHLGYFHLTHRLLPLLVASAPARIINVSSDAHRMASLPLDDPQQEEGYSAWGTYSQSKLANILFTRELARRLEGTGVTTNTPPSGLRRHGLWAGRGADRALPDAYRPTVCDLTERGGADIHLSCLLARGGRGKRQVLRQQAGKTSSAPCL